MASYEVVESTAAHARELSKTLRSEDRLEAERLGLNPDKAVFSCYRNSVYRQTGLVGGRVAAMWGVCGTPLSVVGIPYLLTSPVVEEIPPIRFAKIYVKEVQVMKKLFPVLENYVDAEYETAVRMLSLAGFKLERFLLNQNLFYKFSLESPV